MRQLPCTLLAGIIALAALDSAHRHDDWLSFILAAAAMLVLLAPALFDVPAEIVDEAEAGADTLNPGDKRYYLFEPRR